MKNTLQKLESRGLPWAGFVFGLFGAILATFTYCSTQEQAEISAELQAQQLLFEAVDLLGFEPTGSGNHQLSIGAPRPAMSTDYRERLEKARRAIERLDVLAPDHEDLDDLRLFYYVQSGDMTAAKKMLEKTRTEETKDSDVYAMMAMFLSSQPSGKRKAEFYYQQAISVEEPDVDHLGLYAVFLHSNGNNQKATELLRLALDRNPSRLDLVNTLGHVLAESGQMDEAERLLREHISLGYQPYAPLYNTLGGVLMLTGRHDKAKAFFERAIHYSPDRSLYYYNLSLVLKELGEMDEAESMLKQAYELAGSKQPIEEMLDEPQLKSN